MKLLAKTLAGFAGLTLVAWIIPSSVAVMAILGLLVVFGWLAYTIS